MVPRAFSCLIVAFFLAFHLLLSGCIFASFSGKCAEGLTYWMLEHQAQSSPPLQWPTHSKWPQGSSVSAKEILHHSILLCLRHPQAYGHSMLNKSKRMTDSKGKGIWDSEGREVISVSSHFAFVKSKETTALQGCLDQIKYVVQSRDTLIFGFNIS